MPKLLSPPVNWDPNTVVGVRERIKIYGFGIKKPLNFEDRISQHKSNRVAHEKVRNQIIYNARLQHAKDKDPCDRTQEDDVVIAQRPSLMNLLPNGDGDLPDGDVPGWSDVYAQRVVDMVEDKHTEDVVV